MKTSKRLVASLIAVAVLCGVFFTTMGAAPAANTAENGPSARANTALSDVPAGAWFSEAVNWCLDRNLIDPTGGSTFSPDADASRATLAVALYQAAGSPQVGAAPFNDIPNGSWYANAAAWANANGVIAGYPEGGFGGEDPITREQTVTILWRYAGSPASGASQDFTDESSISAYASQAVDWSRTNGIVNGNPDGSFNPKGHVTRGQIALILRQYLNVGTSTGDGPQVFMTTDISSEGLMKIYEALNWTPGNHVAVKLSTGEPGSNYLRTDLIGGLVQSLDNPTIVECNTAYGGSRSNTAMHYQVARDHGYTAIANVDIMDEDGSMSLPVVGGTNLTENYVGTHFANYDSFLVLSHFKGHAMAGFGGAIKNISIGIASSRGKSHIHSGGTGGSMWGGDQDAFLESMAEAGKSVVEALDGKIVYINVMNRLSVDCDCDGNPAAPDMHDIGILASYDPVALDQACVDLIYAATDGRSLINRMESRHGIHTLEHAEEIGLGSRTYQLVNIDGRERQQSSRQIKMTVANQECIITLNDNSAANELYEMLPLKLTFEDYNQTEKISYLPESLSAEGMPNSFDPDVGDFCYYVPWGNLSLFYKDFRNSTSLISLGHVDSGIETIAGITDDFTVTLEAIR